MKIYFLALVIVISLSACTNGRTTNQSQFREPTTADTINLAEFPSGLPLYRPMFYEQINEQLENRTLRPSLSYHHLLQIGRYQEVNRATELELEWGLDSLDQKEVRKLDTYDLVNAMNYVIEKSDFHRLIIISEAHTKPEHRVFTRCLLEGLYDKGYRHLGLENILPLHQDTGGKPMDSLLNTRGYPTVTAYSGIYTSEPEYGNLIREAVDIGFKIFSYERNSSSDSERDTQQAERINNYMASIPPNEKVICHGGWYHAIETGIPKDKDGNYWMAYEYKMMSGDDPLTIYQDALNEKVASVQTSSPYYNSLLERMTDGDQPLVLTNEHGSTWKGPGDSIPFDIVTIQPPLNYNLDLPWSSWKCNTCKSVDLSIIPGEVTANLVPKNIYIIEIRRSYESELATPIYAREIDSIIKPINVSLCKGSYKITFRSLDGSIIRTDIEI